ncbi:MAG TPA: hypothetical protein VMW27_30685, partial [Thermoanaerobaculia bacterium]|nr:hypothetical protein [Thermoanaerobaculia bacterium]
TLCVVALAAPAAAERIFVPVLGPTAGDGSTLTTKVWIANTDGAGRQVAARFLDSASAAGDEQVVTPGATGQILSDLASTEKAGLIALDAGTEDEEPAVDVTAWMVGNKGLADEVPVFTDREVYAPGVDVPLAQLPRPRAMVSLLVGAANVSEQVASCTATLYGRNGGRLAEIPFEVAPMSLAREDALARAGKGRIAAVHVSCDQSFYPVAVATEGSSRQVVFAKGIGPNGPCNYTVALEQQAGGSWGANTPLAPFHAATRNNPKGIICLRAPQDLRIARAKFEWDVIVGPWSTRDRSGLHNLAYFFLDRYRSGVVGNLNAAGPNKSILKNMQNVGMPRGSNTNAKSNYLLQQNLTYHFVYTFDAVNRTTTFQTFLNGVQVNSFSQDARPGGQQILLRPYAPAGSGPGGLVMVAEFGNYNGQHHPEMPSWDWKFNNFKVNMIPK